MERPGWKHWREMLGRKCTSSSPLYIISIPGKFCNMVLVMHFDLSHNRQIQAGREPSCEPLGVAIDRLRRGPKVSSHLERVLQRPDPCMNKHYEQI